MAQATNTSTNFHRSVYVAVAEDRTTGSVVRDEKLFSVTAVLGGIMNQYAPRVELSAIHSNLDQTLQQARDIGCLLVITPRVWEWSAVNKGDCRGYQGHMSLDVWDVARREIVQSLEIRGESTYPALCLDCPSELLDAELESRLSNLFA